MEQRSFGAVLAALRKERGMTQLELAEKMGVTDKAVSKWERDLSYPDVSSILSWRSSSRCPWMS